MITFSTRVLRFSSLSEQSPSLLTIILDTNPGAWSLLSDTISLSSAVANLLVFINAHLASNYTNKVAVIASHCNKAQWLYPTSIEQQSRSASSSKRRSDYGEGPINDQLSETTKRLKINGSQNASPNGNKGKDAIRSSGHSSSNKYRPFRLVEEELLSNLTRLLTSTSPSDVTSTTSTKIAGALTLALCYINRESIAYAESANGPAANDPTPSTNPDSTQQAQGTLQSRIFVLTVSPTSELAHQYIPIMNTIFACQRLAIPIDICQIPLPLPSSPDSTDSSTTVFLQQASDTTHGIYILIPPPPPGSPNAARGLLTYLLTAFLPPPSSRTHLILPTSISVDFRAACFCHRNIVDIGFVCSICLSIFCAVPENGDCLTCGTHLSLGEYGSAPVVVVRKKGKKRRE
jgi:transcription initiation factor TFIIH subunit 3